ncbi:hypothetical protein TPHA_0A01250 [Tetrapisispora phaffii CBS 4417]|uniref:Autophagy-related protein 21 n=1 Tax=Tetrapisispora phaffii (strain ATCC 24235 / CBS 4417 / NBRC 1672 / NRRL Y-8282 / UCD 70-5) TaxID=1071381 RepID=G8BMT1_TETPH|nr:hypothetical protein TPHA_0A01250 [Tetrapisispora phaffii CBS 4417]CCE61209.1 hypothetical protein TPHA_0A01250 [Tetrapisispora phaffii CBS 4417]
MSYRSLKFNQDSTCFTASSDNTDIIIYNCDPFGKCFELPKNNDILKGNSGGNFADYEHNNSHDDVNNSNGIGSDSDAVNNVDSRKRNHSYKVDSSENALLIEMLFSTNLIAVSSSNKNSIESKKVKIINTKRKSIICELSFPSCVIDIIMNRKRMCVLLETDQIYIYDISCMKHLQTIDIGDKKLKTTVISELQTGNNNDTITSKKKRKIPIKMALSEDDRSILVFTTFNMTNTSINNKNNHIMLNDVVAYDALNITPINYLNAVHNGNVVALTISPDGKIIATASEKGTVIRIFDVGIEKQDELINSLTYEFRRGNRQSTIHQLAFNNNATLIACVGDSDTIHIFKLDSNMKLSTLPMSNSDHGVNNTNNSYITTEDIKGLRKDLNAKSFKNLISKTIKKSIPSQSLDRSFAYINLKNPNNKYVIGFPKEFPNELYIVGENGNFNVYSIPTESGECVLSKRNKY